MPSECQDTGVLQIGKVPGCLCLRELEYFLQVGNAHLFILEDKMEYPEPGFVRTGFKNLGTQRQIETF